MRHRVGRCQRSVTTWLLKTRWEAGSSLWREVGAGWTQLIPASREHLKWLQVSKHLAGWKSATSQDSPGLGPSQERGGPRSGIHQHVWNGSLGSHHRHTPVLTWGLMLGQINGTDYGVHNIRTRCCNFQF